MSVFICESVNSSMHVQICAQKHVLVCLGVCVCDVCGYIVTSDLSLSL